MKGKEIRDKNDDELRALVKTTRDELFQARMRNFTNQLDDTSSIRKQRRELAKLLGEQRRRDINAITSTISGSDAVSGEG